LRRICFSLGWAAGLASLALCGGTLPVWGSDALVRGSDAGRVTSIVRADPHSGKLVRVVLASGAPDASRSVALSSAVDRIALEESLPPELIHSVIKAESNYNPFAISPKGALGIMQLVPATARRFGVSNAFNAEENIQGGAKYLKYLLDLYHGDYPLALAAYNAGEGAVAKHGGIPPYPETQNYVNKVLSNKVPSRPRGAQAKAAPASKPVTAEPPAQEASESSSQYNHIRQIVEPDGSVRYVSR
jgi:Transglycosylase SLT domain